MEGYITKRWFIFFFLFFIPWYPSALLVSTSYEVFGSGWLFLVAQIMTPLWLLIMGYLYFRKARNDWPARFVTAFGWMLMIFLLSALLIEPVYGYPWQGVFTLDAVNGQWMNLIAIIVGGTAAHKSYLA
ncbi:MAG: hypothetical protein HQ488_04075 [Parcubacteria group bacterium]|nr:hypothetical protein [Parcubacteria group bacterium]